MVVGISGESGEAFPEIKTEYDYTKWLQIEELMMRTEENTNLNRSLVTYS